MGRSKLDRFYAFVQTASGDLGEQLVENGLARIHGVSAKPPELSAAQNEKQKLRRLEQEARQARIGGWGVNYGRISMRSPRSGGVPYDSFDAFFHSQRAPVVNAVSAQRPTLSSPPPPAPGSAAPPPTPSAPKTTNAAAEGKLDINTASAAELQNISGIGPVLAERIIAARPFKSADDLKNVKGIGGAKYEKIRPSFN